MHEFKSGYQPRYNLVKNENGDLLADSHNILNWYKNYFPCDVGFNPSTQRHYRMISHAQQDANIPD
jgi:hypothetical protein